MILWYKHKFKIYAQSYIGSKLCWKFWIQEATNNKVCRLFNPFFPYTYVHTRHRNK